MPEELGAYDHIRKEFPSVSPGSKFLHERNTSLHATPEVEHTVGYLRAGGEQIPNEPAAKLEHYLGFLANKEYVNDGILTGDQESIKRQVEAHVIKAEDIPESYFEMLRRIAREQGHGDVAISDTMRQQHTEAIQADQQASLETWVEYLGGDHGSYPDWFKYYVWNSVVKLGSFDKEKGEFLRRSKGTTAAYPELNREALAYVFDNLNKRVNGQKIEGSEKLQQLLNNANFGKLYAHAVLEASPDSPESRKTIEGSWTKYDRTEDPRIARRLSGSLQGHGTTWCTAGESTASKQLEKGDFYVYYTKDQDNKDTVPRIAIRMENGEVREVRGVNPSQELEPDLYDTTMDKLKDLPGGEAYLKKAEDMKRLTALDNKLKSDPTAELSNDDLEFLYELNGLIAGFGYTKDPRIDELISKRDVVTDLAKVLGVETKDQSELMKTLVSERSPHNVTLYALLARMNSLNDEVAKMFIDQKRPHLVSDNLSSYRGLSDEVAQSLIDYITPERINYFANLSEETFIKLLNKDSYDPYAREIWKWLTIAQQFNIKNPQKVADFLINKNMWGLVGRLPEILPDIDHVALAHRLIQEGHASVIGPGDFPKVEDKVFADAWLEQCPAKLVDWLALLQVDKNHYAQRLIASGHLGDLAAEIRSFDGLDKELVEQIKAEQELQRKRKEEAVRREEEMRLETAERVRQDQLQREELGSDYWDGTI